MFHRTIGLKIKESFKGLRDLISENKQEILNIKSIIKDHEKSGELTNKTFETLTEGIDAFNSSLLDIIYAIRNHEEGYTLEELALLLEELSIPNVADTLLEGSLVKDDVKALQKLLSEEYIHNCLNKVYELCASEMNYDVARVFAA